MPLVVPSVTRFTLHGHWTNSRPIANILDMAWDTEGAFGSRNDNIVTIAEDVRNAWQDHILKFMSNNYVFDGVSWVDMDSADGSTGSIPRDTGRQTAGSSEDPAMPPSVAYNVKKFTTGGRSSRSGRWFNAGIPEGSVDEDGIISTGTQASINGHLSDFLGSVTDLGGLELDKAPVVIHAASATGNKIIDLKVDPLVAYQGRRIGR